MNYIVTVDGAERLRFEMDPHQAAAPITWDGGDPTPFQTANARHKPAVAADLLNNWLHSEGGEAWGEDEEWEWEEVDPEPIKVDSSPEKGEWYQAPGCAPVQLRGEHGFQKEAR